MPESLYVHLPFCETRCHYCDFYSIAESKATAPMKKNLAEAIEQEATLQEIYLAPEIQTVFLGGGTPSMTPAASIEKMLSPIFRTHSLASDAEWTIEVNPSSVSKSELRQYRAMGINRISMGVQSMNDDHLRWLGRVHSRKGALSSLEKILEEFENVSVDFLCGIPGQTVEDIHHGLATITQFPIQHLSCYILTLGKQHRLAKSLPSDDVQLEHYLAVQAFLSERGFEQYEISNFCHPNQESQHNLRYWNRKPVIGFGPSAHSFDGKIRWKNLSSLKQYAQSLASQKLPIEWSEALTEEQEKIEEWMLGLRLTRESPSSDCAPNQNLTSSHKKD